MKKIRLAITIAFLCFISSSCVEHVNNELNQESLKNQETDVFLSRVKKDLFSFYPQTKSVLHEVQDLFFYVFDNDTIAKVVQFPSGYSVYSNNDSNDLLVISDQGNFLDAIEHLEFKNTIVALAHNTAIPRTEISRTPSFEIEYDYPIDSESEKSVDPMITVNWGQGAPFNWFTPNGYAGCTPIAIAQIMTYFEFPSIISLTYSGADTSITSLDWDMMKQHNTYHSDTCLYCKENARLLREIGQQCHADYHTGGTGAWPKVQYINQLGYTGKEYSTYNFDSILSSLNSGYPCIISGFRDQESKVGHSWNIDGYKQKIFTRTMYRKKKDELAKIINVEKTYDTYLHFNYGWNGASNGYILSQKRVTGQGLLIVGGSFDEIQVEIFSNDYPDVRMLVTQIRPNI